MKRGRFGQFLACSGYPGVQDDAKADCHEAGQPEGRQAGSDSRREVPALQLEPGHQAGPVRRVHGVHQLPDLQVHQAQDDGRRLPQRRRQGRRGRRAQVEARQDLLRLFELSGLRLRALESTDRRTVSEVRRAVSRGEDHQTPRPPAALQQRGLRLLATGRTARDRVGELRCRFRVLRFWVLGSWFSHAANEPRTRTQNPNLRTTELEPNPEPRTRNRQASRTYDHHRRRGSRRQRGGLAGRVAAASPVTLYEMRPVRVDGRAQDRRLRRARVQQLLPRRQAR